MAKPTKTDLDLLRTKVWIAEVARICGSKTKPATVAELTERAWLTEKGDAPEFCFDKWDRGEHAVSLKSVEKVAECLDYEGLESCIDVFLNGPGGNQPFWTLLSDEVEGYPEAECIKVICDWLYPPEKDKLKRQAFLSKPFSKKVDESWSKLLDSGPIEVDRTVSPELMRVAVLADRVSVDFDGYDSGEQGHALLNRIKQGRLKPSLDLFAVLLAVRQLAERRMECRDQARYLCDACFGMLDLFEPWGMKNVVSEILDSWYSYSNPVVIALMDRSFADMGDLPPPTPATAGLLYQLIVNTARKDKLSEQLSVIR